MAYHAVKSVKRQESINPLFKDRAPGLTDPGYNSLLVISHGTSILLLIVYMAYLIFQLRTHAALFQPKRGIQNRGDSDAQGDREEEGEDPKMNIVSVCLMWVPFGLLYRGGMNGWRILNLVLTVQASGCHGFHFLLHWLACVICALGILVNTFGDHSVFLISHWLHWGDGSEIFNSKAFHWPHSYSICGTLMHQCVNFL